MWSQGQILRSSGHNVGSLDQILGFPRQYSEVKGQQILGSRGQILGSRGQILGSQGQILGFQGQILDYRHQKLGPILCSWPHCGVPGSDLGYWVPNPRAIGLNPRVPGSYIDSYDHIIKCIAIIQVCCATICTPLHLNPLTLREILDVRAHF